MNLRHIPEEHRNDILEMQWIRDIAAREYDILGPLGEWLQDGDRGYEDIPPGLRKDIFFKDLRTGETHPCSVWESLGYGRSEMEGESWLEYIHPDDRDTVRKSFHSYVYKEDLQVGQSLFRVRNSEGVYHWLFSTSAAIARNKDHAVFRYVGRDVDVGNRLERELSLKRRIHEIEDRSARESALMAAAGDIAGSTDEAGLIESINHSAGRLLGLNRVRVIMLDDVGYRLARGELLPEDFDWTIFDRLSPNRGTALPGHLYCWHLGDVAEGHALIAFANGHSPEPEADRLMSVLGPIILGAWERVRHFDTLRRHATTDPLTGAWNRRAFMQQAGRSLRRAGENGKTCVVAIMDIDLFKKVNDEFGHPFGDKVLMDVATGMSEALRSGDFMCRWGGEEFALFLDGIIKDDAVAAIDRIRQRSGEYRDESGHSVTLSAGLHLIDPDSRQSLESALKKADDALMTAKKTGRNRSVVFSGVQHLSADNNPA